MTIECIQRLKVPYDLIMSLTERLKEYFSSRKAVPEGYRAILVIPDQVDGALFGRDGQGALMESPVQVRSLLSRVLVVTPPSLGEHAPRLAMLPPQAFRLEHWVWNVKEEHFERLHLRQILDQPIKFGYYKH